MKSLILIFFLSLNVIASVKVSVSIKPIHSIVSLLTDGVTDPDLLIKGNQSAHHFFMKPSHAMKIMSSDLFILIDKDFEAGLQKITNNLDKNKIFYFSNTSKNILSSKDNLHSSDSINPHLWLDKENVINFAKGLSEKLRELYPENSKQLQKNLDLFLKKFSMASQSNFPNNHKKKIILQSNSAEYFLNDNNIKDYQIISNNHEGLISMKKYNEIIKLSDGNKIACLIADYNSNYDLIEKLAKEINTQLIVIDVIGRNSKDYYKFTQSIYDKFYKCLQ
jgi:zinc transport system substrate-binding protein